MMMESLLSIVKVKADLPILYHHEYLVES